MSKFMLEKYQSLEAEDLSKTVGGKGYKNSGMSKKEYELLTKLGKAAESYAGLWHLVV